MKVAHRFAGPGKPYDGLTTLRKGKVDWSGVARFVPSALAEPLSWRKPARIFVNSMSDLFHHSVTNEEIAAVFGVMAACPQHTFQILTKRADRMRQWFGWALAHRAGNGEPRWNRGTHQVHGGDIASWLEPSVVCERAARTVGARWRARHVVQSWPLPNIWLGVSAEDQQRADERIPHLLATPAAVRFVSAEPLLGAVDLARYLTRRAPLTHFVAFSEEAKRAYPDGAATLVQRGIDWVIVGGESGPGARLADMAHHRAIIKQCRGAGVAVFYKQAGANVIDSDFGLHPVTLKDRKGGEMSEWPADLRVREFPGAQP